MSTLHERHLHDTIIHSSSPVGEDYSDAYTGVESSLAMRFSFENWWPYLRFMGWYLMGKLRTGFLCLLRLRQCFSEVYNLFYVHLWKLMGLVRHQCGNSDLVIPRNLCFLRLAHRQFLFALSLSYVVLWKYTRFFFFFGCGNNTFPNVIHILDLEWLIATISKNISHPDSSIWLPYCFDSIVSDNINIFLAFTLSWFLDSKNVYPLSIGNFIDKCFIYLVSLGKKCSLFC